MSGLSDQAAEGPRVWHYDGRSALRREAVLAVAAPAGGGCVLRLRGGRELAAAEAAAVAVGLLAESGA